MAETVADYDRTMDADFLSFVKILGGAVFGMGDQGGAEGTEKAA